MAWNCPKCSETVEDSFAVCWSCGTSQDGVEDPEFESEREPDSGTEVERAPLTARQAIPDGMVLSTTPTLEGRTVKRYLGIVCGEVIAGADAFSDIIAGITDFIGGRSGAYESVLAEARQIALAEMAFRANKLGANAVLAVSLNYESVRGSMLMVTCSGTAVEVTGS